MEILRTENLTFAYPGDSGNALNNINISIEKGDFALLCGFSGSGKSTLLKMLKKEAAPNGKLSGTVYAGGKDIMSLSPMESASLCGFVGQDPDAQIITDRVWHELAFGPESVGMKSDAIRRIVSETADYFGLTDIKNSSTDGLSGGQKQILNLASAMVMNPQILLLDEPASRLDPVSAQRFSDAVKRLNRDFGVTVIETEHRYDMMLGDVNKVIMMDSGSAVMYTDIGEACARMMDSGLGAGMPAFVKMWDMNGRAGNAPLTLRDGKKYFDEHFGNVSFPKNTKQEFNDNKDKTDKTGSAVSAEKLFFRYERNGRDIADDVSFEIPSGKITAVVGGNGAGKSTLLSVLAGVRSPYSGNVKIFGRKISKYGADLCRKISFMPQDPKLLFVGNTVKEDILNTSRAAGSKDPENSAMAVSRQCEITHLLGRNPYDLSGGELQLCALARILAADTDILLLDEPTKGMDPVLKERFMKVLKDTVSSGKTAVFVTHDIDFAAETADFCVYMSSGRVISSGSPCDMFCGNGFYSTMTAKITSGSLPGVVSFERLKDVLEHENA